MISALIFLKALDKTWSDDIEIEFLFTQIVSILDKNYFKLSDIDKKKHL